MRQVYNHAPACHCEERSDEAIFSYAWEGLLRRQITAARNGRPFPDVNKATEIHRVTQQKYLAKEVLLLNPYTQSHPPIQIQSPEPR